VGMELLSIVSDDARRFLTAVLKCVQTECRVGRGVGAVIDTK